MCKRKKADDNRESNIACVERINNTASPEKKRKRESFRKKIYTGINARIFTIRPKGSICKEVFLVFDVSFRFKYMYTHEAFVFISNSSRQLAF